jgi:hypothetical protein
MLLLSLLAGSLAIAGEVSRSFKLQGDPAVYYPVFFYDGQSADGAFDLRIHRSCVHIDGDWLGSMMVEISSHSSGWGNGSDFLDSAVYVNGHEGSLIAGMARPYYALGVVVWLRGNRTYYYISNHALDIHENSATGAELVTYEYPQYSVREVFQNRTSVDPALEVNGRTVGANQRIQGRLIVDGNVGVGTLSPTHKLSVNGAIRAKEVIVDTNWADYVFDDSYKLMPLAQVAAHIKAEKHLPGVPTASEIAAQGVSLGEMQAILLSKIEELTLHQIEQERRLETLSTENAELRTTIRVLERAASPSGVSGDGKNACQSLGATVSVNDSAGLDYQQGASSK